VCRLWFGEVFIKTLININNKINVSSRFMNKGNTKYVSHVVDCVYLRTR
jgi:hypothetical protein